MFTLSLVISEVVRSGFLGKKSKIQLRVRLPVFFAAAMTLRISARFRSILLFSSLLALVLCTEYLIIQRPDFIARPTLSAAVTFDLLVWPPVLFYALIVRRYRLPITSVGAVFAAMLVLGSYLIPVGQQQYLRGAKHILPVLEAATLLLLLLNIRRLRLAYLAARPGTPDITANFSVAFAAVFDRPLEALVFEVSLWYHAFLSWKSSPRHLAGQQAFSGHEQSGFVALLLTFAGLSVVETVAAHFLLLRWNHSVALVALFLNVYTLVGFIGHLRAVLLCPPVLLTASGELLLRAGLVWRLAVPVGSLTAVRVISDVPPATAGLLNLAKPLLAPPNLLLTFAEPVAVIGPYGLRRQAQQVAVYVDAPASCYATLMAAPNASGKNP
jgi:hypothetical protein